MTLGLLLAYVHLVKLAVQQGEQARAATAARSQAPWH
jgi:hypothetical protein